MEIQKGMRVGGNIEEKIWSIGGVVDANALGR